MASPAEKRLQMLLESPAFRLRFWQFILDVPNVEPTSLDFHLAVQLAATVRNLLTEAQIAAGRSEQEAHAKVRQAITEERDFYAVLAGAPQPDHEPPG